MGAFHVADICIAVLCKRFADAGLRDSLVESGVVASGSVDAVLTGHHYNRSIRAHKFVWEALFRFRWKQFEESVGGTLKKSGIDLERITDRIHDLRLSCSKEKWLSLS